MIIFTEVKIMVDVIFSHTAAIANLLTGCQMLGITNFTKKFI
jgi:hypothetical protein